MYESSVMVIQGSFSTAPTFSFLQAHKMGISTHGQCAQVFDFHRCFDRLMDKYMIRLNYKISCLFNNNFYLFVKPRKMKPSLRIVCIISLLVIACREKPVPPVAQIHLPRIDAMADIPRPLHIISWYDMARRFDSAVYDFNATGPHWPVVWWDSSRRNFPQNVVGLYTAMDDQRQGTQQRHVP